MNVLRKTMLIFSMALLTAACDKDAIEEIGGEIPGTEVTKTVNLWVPAMGGETRVDNTASANESAIDNVYVFQFNASDGKLYNDIFQYFSGNEITNVDSSTKTVGVALDDAASTIYVVANLGANYFTKDNCPKTLTDFQKETYKFSAVISKTDVDNGTIKLPMVGKTTVTAGASNIKIDMKRLVAKIGYTLNKAADAPASLKLTSARLEYVLNTVLLDQKTADATRQYPAAPAADDFFNSSTKYVYEEYTADDITGSEHIWYVPENLGGQNGNISGPKYKGGANVPDKYCTRIIVSGTVTYENTEDTEISFVIYPGDNATTDFNIERNKVYSITSTVKNINITDLRVNVEDFTDLSAEGTSNCYMIHEAGKYKFKCNVMGNGVNAVGSTTPIDATVTSATITDVSSCEALWEMTGSAGNTVTKNTVIKDGTLKLDGDYVTFETPDTFKEGNALIAVKNASGTILWSWHIWSTEYDPNENYDVYTTAARSVAGQKAWEDVMRCNLGATGAGKEGTTAEGTATVAGFWYQWGRKDPFRHNVTSTPNTTSTNEPTTMAIAIQNPTRFYRASSSPWDWRSGQNNNLWGNPNTVAKNPNTDRGIKTMYDPCPVGWKVAPQDLWNSLSGSWSSPAWVFNSANATRNGSQSQIKYFAAGYLNYSAGAVTNVTSYGRYWSSSSYSGDTNAGYLYFYSGGVTPVYSNCRANGYSVRCVREIQRASK